jgi:RNA polymerase sigma-70 factor, ECF subfamily
MGSGLESQSKGITPPSALAELDFEVQFKAAFRILWLVAAGIVGRSSAEDVVQEAALLAIGKIAQFEPGTNFTAWMATLVRYVALNYSRRMSRQKTMGISDLPDRPAGPQEGAGESMKLGSRGELPTDQGMFGDELAAALRTIGEEARACLLLKVVGGLEYSEISKILEIPQGTAMSHVHRARQRIREQMTDDREPRSWKGGLQP